MNLPILSSKALLHLVPILSLALVAPAAYVVTETDLSKSFRLYSGNEKGGCNRNAPNGVPMQQRVLSDLDDAFNLVQTFLDQIPRASSPDGDRIRCLWKLFFGVSFHSDNHRINTSDGSLATFKFVSGT